MKVGKHCSDCSAYGWGNRHGEVVRPSCVCSPGFLGPMGPLGTQRAVSRFNRLGWDGQGCKWNWGGGGEKGMIRKQVEGAREEKLSHLCPPPAQEEEAGDSAGPGE